jgi:hypothetical protein
MIEKISPLDDEGKDDMLFRKKSQHCVTLYPLLMCLHTIAAKIHISET